MSTRRPLLAGTLALAALALTLTACDTSTPLEHRADDGALVQTARSWFDQNTTALAKTGSDDERSLREFFPDWANGAVVEGPSGEHAVVTRLRRNVPATYDSTLYFLRVLAVVVNDSGAVTKGRIVEFASPDSIGEGDGPALVRSWLRSDYGSRTVFVAEHTAGYEFVEGAAYGPNKAPVPLRVTTERCAVEAAGKTMATEMACSGWELVETYTTCVPNDTGWSCRRHERWSQTCALIGDTREGGSGTVYYNGTSTSFTTNTDPGYSQPVRPPDMIDLVRAIINEVQRGSRFDDPAMWRRLLGALNPQAGQCVDALGSLGGSLDASEVSAIINCASTYLTGSSGGAPIDGTDIVDMLATVPGGLEWAARSASDTALYPWLIQSARDNSDRLRTVALNGRGLDALHALGLLNDTSTGITHNYKVDVLSAMEALRTLGTVSGTSVAFVGRDGRTYTAYAYSESSQRSGSVPSVQISPCPGYLGVNCSSGYKYVFRFPSFDTLLLP